MSIVYPSSVVGRTIIFERSYLHWRLVRYQSFNSFHVYFQMSTDSPQDLRVRHRELDDTDKTKSSSTETDNKKANPTKTLSWCEELTKRLPPVTVLVPYPIVIPLPLPIPIPIPINQFPKPNEQPNENSKPSSPLTRSRKRKRPNDLSAKKKIIPV